ncbi:hypothetical protein AtEden1_Chr5g0127661 [Arabidopsis thaliana]
MKISHAFIFFPPSSSFFMTSKFLSFVMPSYSTAPKVGIASLNTLIACISLECKTVSYIHTDRLWSYTDRFSIWSLNGVIHSYID